MGGGRKEGGGWEEGGGWGEGGGRGMGEGVFILNVLCLYIYLLSSPHIPPLPAALGDDCSPLPMQPVMVGYDHEWLAVSPLALPAWVSCLHFHHTYIHTVCSNNMMTGHVY